MVMVRFERGTDAEVGPILGPYEWVQLTYESLRASPDGDVIAFLGEDSHRWYVMGPDYRTWADVVIG
jgi:hypothetical protein